MANVAVRPVGYTGLVEEIVWTQGDNVPVRAYLWGGGGGGGGNDSASGGTGGGGGFAEVNFTVNEGDSIKIAVGGQGGPGASGASGSGAGFAGASLIELNVFDTRSATSSPPVYPQFNSNYCTFLNTYGVWESNTRTQDFDRSYIVSFPSTGLYTFTASSDNSAVVSLDGTPLFISDSFGNTFEQPVQVTAGNHTVRIQALNTGGPGSVALTISSGTSYSGARGGNAGGGGSSGAGGGSGGATVLLLNDVVIGVAGGGGGGGGGGNGPVGQSAPGPNGFAAYPVTNGQNGTNKNGDGGGGGGGGGGYGGGNGGQAPGGDQGGQAGSWGNSYSINGTTANPTASLAAGSTYPYYNAERGRGGGATQQGTSGSAVLEFQINGAYVKVAGTFEAIEKIYVKFGGLWRQVQATYVKQGGIWKEIRGTFGPQFNLISNLFGINSREAAGDAGQGGGGGGSKIICTKLYELGLMDKGIYLADQAFGAKLIQSHPDIYNGYRAWAEIVVDWMNGQGPKMMPWMSDQQFSAAAKKWSVSWAQDIATPWAESMAYQMGHRESDNFTGKMITLVGTPICKVVGVWQRVFGRSQQPAGFVKGAMLIPVFVLLKIVAVLGKLIQRR